MILVKFNIIILFLYIFNFVMGIRATQIYI